MNVFTTAGLGTTCLATAPCHRARLGPGASDSEQAEGERLEFTHALDDEPLDVYTPREGEEFTEAVEEFHVSGENPMTAWTRRSPTARTLFNRNCRACHGVEGAGGMGPALNDEDYKRERAATDKGRFEIITAAPPAPCSRSQTASTRMKSCA
jgi:cytochrome c(L)